MPTYKIRVIESPTNIPFMGYTGNVHVLGTRSTLALKAQCHDDGH